MSSQSGSPSQSMRNKSYRGQQTQAAAAHTAAVVSPSAYRPSRPGCSSCGVVSAGGGGGAAVVGDSSSGAADGDSVGELVSGAAGSGSAAAGAAGGTSVGGRVSSSPACSTEAGADGASKATASAAVFAAAATRSASTCARLCGPKKVWRPVHVSQHRHAGDILCEDMFASCAADGALARSATAIQMGKFAPAMPLVTNAPGSFFRAQQARQHVTRGWPFLPDYCHVGRIPLACGGRRLRDACQ